MQRLGPSSVPEEVDLSITNFSAKSAILQTAPPACLTNTLKMLAIASRIARISAAAGIRAASSAAPLAPFHIAVPVSCLDAARKFYGDVLKCEEGRSSR